MESLHYLLMKSNALFSRKVLSKAAKLGLTPGQPKILEFLLNRDECDQKTIAAYCEIEPATVGSILLRMENADLISRRQRDGNRRSLYVSLTEKGRQAAEKMINVFREAEAPIVEQLSEKELYDLIVLLEKISKIMMRQNYEKSGI